MSHIQDHVGHVLTKASIGTGGVTSFMGFKGWIEENSIVIGIGLTVLFGVIGAVIQWKNYKLNQRRVAAMEKQNELNEKHEKTS